MSNETRSVDGTSKRKTRSGQFVWPTLIAVGILGAGALIATWLASDGAAAYSGPTAEVRRGNLTISVSESGSLRNRDRAVVTNRVEGRTTILWIIEEGRFVEEGDLLVELDSSDLQNELVESRIEVQNAEADFIRAREQLEVTKSQNESDIAAAELTLRLAKLDLARYLGRSQIPADSGEAPSDAELDRLVEEAERVTSGETPDGVESMAEGEYAQERERIISNIELSEEELTRARQQYEDSQRLFERDFITELELEGDRLSMERARIDLRLARGQLHLLENYTHQRDLEQLQSDVAQAERALERVKLTANSNRVQAEAGFNSAEQEWQEEQRELAKIQQQLEYCEIRAPAAGMVVYETSANQRRRGNDEPLEAGQEVRERQELIYLPSSQGMIADVNVHESALDLIAVDMPARITVDARPGHVFEGRVTRIAPMPDAQSLWLNPDLTVYSTQIEIDADNLRTGMSCRAEIIVDELTDVVYAPLQSVIRFDGRHYAYVLTPEGPQPRQVEIGMDNNRVVHIRSGLEAGEIVLLAPPLTSEMREDEEEKSEAAPETDGFEQGPPEAETATALPEGEGDEEA